MKIFLLMIISLFTTLSTFANDYAFEAIIEYDHHHYDTPEKILALRKELAMGYTLGFSMSECEFKPTIKSHNQSFHRFTSYIELDFSNTTSGKCKAIYEQELTDEYNVVVQIIDL